MRFIYRFSPRLTRNSHDYVINLAIKDEYIPYLCMQIYKDDIPRSAVHLVSPTTHGQQLVTIVSLITTVVVLGSSHMLQCSYQVCEHVLQIEWVTNNFY